MAEPTELDVRALTTESFAPYGEVILPTEDGVLFGDDDAELELHRGTPRFYVMRLHDKPPAFARITRHRQVTQCLASTDASTWYIAVAPPDDVDVADARPDLGRLAAFAVPGGVAIKLHRGTWHAGPFFEPPTMSFFNLELSDTNEVDHHTERIPPHRLAVAPLVQAV